MSEGLWIAIAVIAVLLIAAIVVGLVRFRRRQISLRPSSETPAPIDRSGGYTASTGISFSSSAPTPPAPPTADVTGLPGVGDDAALPRDSVKRPIADVRLPEPEVREEPVTEVAPKRR